MLADVVPRRHAAVIEPRNDHRLAQLIKDHIVARILQIDRRTGGKPRLVENLFHLALEQPRIRVPADVDHAGRQRVLLLGLGRIGARRLFGEMRGLYLVFI